jgi:hypothetical protein
VIQKIKNSNHSLCSQLGAFGLLAMLKYSKIWLSSSMCATWCLSILCGFKQTHVVKLISRSLWNRLIRVYHGPILMGLVKVIL